MWVRGGQVWELVGRAGNRVSVKQRFDGQATEDGSVLAREEDLMPRLGEAIALSALIISVVALLVNYLSAHRRHVLGIRPVLAFEYQEGGWTVHNVGNGPAMDVVFTRLRGNDVHEHVRLPALARGAAFPLHFCRHDNHHRFGATYRDFEGRAYTSQSAEDRSVTSRGFRVQRPTPPVIQWWKLPERDS